ncbi:hypothetical protein [Bacillus sp. FJAT-26390]|uniref:hypothetical protein n=1 Tax=Bacillus sp. FJAT-26390 TaxID=1743142 RepID=UPI00080804BD|nr:hypothetical protein [Bacillus sp. FJAT-26390]OBZ11417.1 hypothetical protein A7975_21035 [Bacillus sp. FJAT-26390]
MKDGHYTNEEGAAAAAPFSSSQNKDFCTYVLIGVKLTGSYFSIALVFMLETMVKFNRNMCLFFCIFQRIGGIGVVEIIEKEQFSVIGKLGKGFANEAPQWIPSLWKEANSNFIEISNLAIHHHVQATPVCFVKEPMCT